MEPILVLNVDDDASNLVSRELLLQSVGYKTLVQAMVRMDSVFSKPLKLIS
jgi:hypothetical protein